MEVFSWLHRTSPKQKADCFRVAVLLWFNLATEFCGIWLADRVWEKRFKMWRRVKCYSCQLKIIVNSWLITSSVICSSLSDCNQGATRRFYVLKTRTICQQVLRMTSCFQPNSPADADHVECWRHWWKKATHLLSYFLPTGWKSSGIWVGSESSGTQWHT